MQQHQELARLPHTVQSHEDATRALNARLLDLEQAVPGPAAGASSSASSSRQLEERVDHVVAMLDDISTFAAPTTISSQLHTLKTEFQQLQSTNADDNPKMYKMPTFQLDKFDDYTQQDPVLWWEAFTTQLTILAVAKHAYIGALFLNSKGGCQTWLSHLATSHGVDVPDLKDKITWEELTRLWKNRFIVDDAPTLAINRLFTMSQGNTATRDWLTEWQTIAAMPNLDLPFIHLKREFYNRSCSALSQALGDREQYSTFAEIIDKAREIIKTNRSVAHEKSTWQPTYVEKVRTGPRQQHFTAVQSDSGDNPAVTPASSDRAVQLRSNNKSRNNGKAKSASQAGNGQPVQLGKLSSAEGEATPPSTPPDSAALLAASCTSGEDANVASSRYTYEDYAVHLVPPLDQPLHVQQSTACTVSSPSATDSATSPPSIAGDSSSWSRREVFDPLTFTDFQWMPVPPTRRLSKPHCNVLMAQLRDYLHTAVPAPLMDAGAEVVDLHAHIAKIDREFKTQRKAQPTQVTLADGHTHKSIDRCIDAVPVYFAPHASEAVSFDIRDTKFDMILGMSWLRSEDHPVNFFHRTVHIRDRNGVLIPCTMPLPHPSISCHEVSAASMRASIIRDDIEEMGVCFLHALPPHDASSTNSPSDPRITELLDAYSDVFEGPHGVVPDRPIRHEIILKDGAVPPRGCIYRMSEEEFSVLRAQLDDLMEKGWIRPSSSPYGAPVLFVRKKNKDLWLCIDYRKLNAQTIRNTGPLPRIDDLLERLGGAKFFSKLDLKSGYHQLEIRKEDRYETAFKTRYGHFEWLVMSFGLTNAPTTFQAAMTTEFRHMLDRFALIHLEDILVYSRSLEEHVEHLRTDLERLRQAKYKANRDKCEFAQQELEYLGHYVTPQGIRPLADKIEALQVWPDPTNTTDVRSFMGLAGYYQRFITGYSRIAAPMTRLQSPKVPFVFDDDARRSFQALKTAMLMAPVLSIYDPTLPTRVTTDASGFGIGAVLEQHDGDDWHPVEYFSHKIELEEQRQVEAEAARLQAAAEAAAEQARLQAATNRESQERRKEAHSLLQRQETATIERLKFWHFEPSDEHEVATAEEEHKEFLSKIVQRNQQQLELENIRQAVQNHKALHEDPTRVLNARIQDLEKPRPEAGQASTSQPAASSRQFEERLDHVVTLLGDINKFAAPVTVSQQLTALQAEVWQLQLPSDGNSKREYKMPTSRIKKFDDYTHQDPVNPNIYTCQSFTMELRIHRVPEYLYVSALYLKAKGGCQIWLNHMATIHGVVVADMHTKISWEVLMKEWKKRFIVDDVPALAINRIFGMSQGNTPTQDWLTEWQKIVATTDLDFSFPHLRLEYYN
ncbi:hypothetical protein CBR_g41548 [Chara braunii]|uniref:Reverse transcriptase domain-containing protein n=1 Tax=Chara braunii TaxID=69332 RepID=A0A388K2U3_CHABU|nr:hypothetical protein CBR_g41548 [Chara braunii]|eukprot:GBG64347.1 hypothetical protein CBR_g41548 [Chara braunii]